MPKTTYVYERERELWYLNIGVCHDWESNQQPYTFPTIVQSIVSSHSSDSPYILPVPVAVWAPQARFYIE